MKIVINADDFAASENINNTILMLHRRGIVTSATIIAAGKNFNHAVEISRNFPKLDIGVHLCLDSHFNIGKNYDTILDKNTNQFYDIDKILKKLKMFSINRSEIYKEYCLQIEKVLDNGIQVSHLDHHHHLHLFLPVLIKAAKKYKISYIRPPKMLLYKHNSCFNYVYRNAIQSYLKYKLNTIDGLFDPAITGKSNYEDHYERLSELLRRKDKTIEIILHPIDKNDPETMFYSSKKVLDLLTNQKLISYHDLR
jgi:predicted glycoside hydrolase/deacetylase ChbG (UPF0249 family)